MKTVDDFLAELFSSVSYPHGSGSCISGSPSARDRKRKIPFHQLAKLQSTEPSKAIGSEYSKHPDVQKKIKAMRKRICKRESPIVIAPRSRELQGGEEHIGLSSRVVDGHNGIIAAHSIRRGVTATIIPRNRAKVSKTEWKGD